MSNIQVEAKTAEFESPIAVDYDFGDNLEEAVEKFGAEVVYTNFKQSAIISLQSNMRGKFRSLESKAQKEGKVVDWTDTEWRDNATLEAQVAADGWKPGIRTATGKSKEEKARDLLGQLTPEQRAALLAQFFGGQDEDEAVA